MQTLLRLTLASIGLTMMGCQGEEASGVKVISQESPPPETSTAGTVKPTVTKAPPPAVSPPQVDEALDADATAIPPKGSEITTAPRLSGAYKTNCVTLAGLGPVIITNIYTPTTLTSYMSTYQDAQCLTISATTRTDYTLTFGPASTRVAGAFEYELIEKSAQTTYFSILKVEGKKIYVGANDGNGNDGLTAAKRFPILATNFHYTLIE